MSHRDETEPESPLARPVRRWRASDQVLPAFTLMLIAGLLLGTRMLLSDWQGLATETSGTWARLGHGLLSLSLDALGAPLPGRSEVQSLPRLPRVVAPRGPELAQARPSAATQDRPAEHAAGKPSVPPPPATELPLREGPLLAQADPPAPPMGVDPAPSAPEAATPAPANAAKAAPEETAAAVDEIQREAEQKKAERAELEKLRRQAEARAKARPKQPDAPLNGFAWRLDPRQREQFQRQQRALEQRMLQELARSQKAWQAQLEQLARGMEAGRGGAWPPMPDWPPRFPGRAGAGDLQPFVFGNGQGRVQRFSGPGNVQGFVFQFGP